MPFLKSLSAHQGRMCTQIQEYLERDGRALTRDFANILGEDNKRYWARYMDVTRGLRATDSGSRAVLWRQFVISPAPGDDVDLETLRELTMDWVRHFFGDQFDAGLLGCYQVAIVYHNDGGTKTHHAHVIVNNCNLAHGQDGDAGRYKRLNIGKKTVNELSDYLQEIGARYGLSCYEETMHERHKRLAAERKQERRQGAEVPRRYYTKTERTLTSEGRYSWKNAIADYVVVARRTSKTMEEFLEALGKLGVGVRERDGDYIYSHPSRPDRWQCSGYRIGKSYTKEAIERAISQDAKAGCPRSDEVRKNVIDYLTEEFPEIKLELRAVADRSLDVHQVAKTLRTIDHYGVRSAGELSRLIVLYEGRLAQAGSGPDAKRYEDMLAELRDARECAAHGNFFLGVADTGNTPTPAARSARAAAMAETAARKTKPQNQKQRKRGQAANQGGGPQRSPSRSAPSNTRPGRGR